MTKKFKYPLLNSYLQQAIEQDQLIDSQDSCLSRSQSAQDLFVVAMTQGKLRGTFLELGCSQPVYSNNTWVLEKCLMWSGISIDIDYDENQSFNSYLHIIERSWPLGRPGTQWFKADALTFNYDMVPYYSDYLQIDIDPPAANLQLLELLIPAKKFAVITFEHDNHNLESQRLQIRQRSRDLLISHGYVLIANDIGCYNGEKFNIYEDWWVNPSYIDKSVINAYTTVDFDKAHHWQEVLFNYESL